MSSGNFLFYLLMGFGPLVALSSSNWLVCWVGVELSFLGLIPILMSDKAGVTLNKECSLKYFCIQAAGSGILMCGGLLKFNMPFLPGISDYIFLFSLFLKLGVFPFHFWVPGIVSGLGWPSIFLVLSWQKVAPFLFLMNLLENSPWLSKVVVILGGASAIVGSVIGLNQTNISPLLGASSITHTGWLLLAVVWGSFWLYFLIYIFCFFLLLVFLNNKENLFSGLLMLSLSGLPPFFMFIGKWGVIKSVLCVGDSLWYLIFPLLGSIMSLFFYLKVFYSFYMEADVSPMSKIIGLCCSGALGLFGALLIVGF